MVVIAGEAARKLAWGLAGLAGHNSVSLSLCFPAVDGGVLDGFGESLTKRTWHGMEKPRGILRYVPGYVSSQDISSISKVGTSLSRAGGAPIHGIISLCDICASGWLAYLA